MNPPGDSHHFLHYSQTLDSDTPRCELRGDEHHHLSRVLRMEEGDETFVTNGRGVIARCIIDTVDKQHTALTVGRLLEPDTASPEVTLAPAVLKKDAFEQVVRQCTELGVTHFVPYLAEKCDLRDYSHTFLERIGKIALAAMKQSFRAVLPGIDEVRGFGDLLAMLDGDADVVVGDPTAAPIAAPAVGHVVIVVGPEAGLTDAEAARLRDAGCSFASAGRGRLRAETAAAALVACVGSRDPRVV